MVCGCAKAPSADAFAFSLSSPGRRAAFAATQPAATTLLRKHEQTDSAARSGLDRHGMGRPGAERMLARGKDQFPGCRKSTRLNSSHQIISYAVFCLKKKKKNRKE